MPWFTTLFGRDSIITAFQTLAFRPQIAVETLDVLASLQATEVDDWRDAEPGKILHEIRVGETAKAGELPHSPYYGSIDSTPLWLVLLGATYDWTGDRALVDRLWPNALAALRWIDEWGDRDGDGFVEYERRSPRGLLNQGWKDSGDAIRDRNGRESTRPDCPCRGPGLCLRREEPDGGAGPNARRDRSRRPAHARGDPPPGPLRGGVLGRGSALLRDGSRWQEAAGRRDRIERGPLPVERNRLAGRGLATSPTG